MPAYSVKMDKDLAGLTFLDGKQAVIVSAPTVAAARELAKLALDGDSNPHWETSAIVTEISSNPNGFQDFVLFIDISNVGTIRAPAPNFFSLENFGETSENEDNNLVDIFTRGSGYLVNDIVSLTGGTSTVTATVRVKEVDGGGAVQRVI